MYSVKVDKGSNNLSRDPWEGDSDREISVYWPKKNPKRKKRGSLLKHIHIKYNLVIKKNVQLKKNPLIASCVCVCV